MLVVEDSLDDSCGTKYYDLETGNWMVCFDADGEIRDEQIPHAGLFAFPIVEGTNTAVGKYVLHRRVCPGSRDYLD